MVSDGLSLLRFVFKFYFICVYPSVCMCNVCVQVLWIPEEASDPLLTRVRDDCKPSDVGAKQSLGLLQKGCTG